MTVNDLGRANVWTRSMESFSLQKMVVEKVLLPEADWIAFLGYRVKIDESNQELEREH